MVSFFRFGTASNQPTPDLESRTPSTPSTPSTPTDGSEPNWSGRSLLRVLESSLDPLIVSDAEGKIQLASQSTLAVFGWEPQEIVGKNLGVLMPEPIRSEHDEYLAQYRRNGVENVIGAPREVQGQRRDGQLFPCEICVNRVDVPEDPRLFFVAVLRDITLRRYREERWRALVAAAPTDVVTVNSELGMKVHSSRQGTGGNEQPPDELFGMGERERVRHWIKQALETGEPGRLECEAADRSTSRRVSCRIQPFSSNERENEAILTFTDVTELHSAKRSIELMRGVAAAGRSAALALHQINNPLASIKNATLILREIVPSDHPNAHFLNMIAEEADRAAKRTRHIMDVHSPEFASVDETPLHESIEEVVTLLRVDAFAADVEIVYAPIDSIVVLTLPHGLLREIVFQLLQNAIDASPRGDRVHIETSIGSHQLRVGIRDAGCGIHPDISERTGEPVFSHEDGGHLGLGLATCHDLAQKAGWTVRHQLLEPTGTSAELIIPLGTDAAVAQR